MYCILFQMFLLHYSYGIHSSTNNLMTCNLEHTSQQLVNSSINDRLSKSTEHSPRHPTDYERSK